MATFDFFTSASVAKKVNNIVDLKYHEARDYSDEYFTYTDADGNEHKYSGIITKVGNTYTGRFSTVNRVDLTYHPEIAHVDASPAHFTYLDASGKECEFLGSASFDESTSTYTGKIRLVDYIEEEVRIYPM